jgi:stage V sporulation protein K
MKGQNRLQQANFPSENEKIKEILTELNDLIGLDTVKNLIFELQAFIEIQKCREKLNLTSEPTVLL